MGWFKSKPTEDELETSVLFAAMIARAKERETNTLTTDVEIKEMLSQIFDDIGVKPGAKENQVSLYGVQALLTEGKFIDEAVNFRLQNGAAPMPISFREKMRRAMQASVDDFLAHKDTL